MKIYFFCLLLGLSLETNYILPKYGTKIINLNDYLYLDISDFKIGDYIELEVSSYCEYYGCTLDLLVTDQIKDYFYPYEFNRTSSYNFNGSSKYIYYNNRRYYYYTHYYKIQKNTNKKYLLIKTEYSRCNNSFEVKHAGGPNIWLYILLGTVSFIIFVGIIIYCIKKKPNYPSVISTPLISNNPSQSNNSLPPYLPPLPQQQNKDQSAY